MSTAKLILKNAGYNVANSEFMLQADKYNVAQSRKRHFLIAIKSDIYSGFQKYDLLANAPLCSMDVISDLVNIDSSSLIDTASELSQDNRKRIDYLFQHKIYDLPDKERPACHRDKKHNYSDVYGRMYPDKPSMTLTTGFQSPGRGRYVHPTQRRGLTPREGARLQSFPDYFRWKTPLCNVSKQSIARLIGDAVPPNLGEIAALIAIASCQKLR